MFEGRHGAGQEAWPGKQEGQQTEGLGKVRPQRNRVYTPGSTKHPTTIPRWSVCVAQRAFSRTSEFAWD